MSTPTRLLSPDDRKWMRERFAYDGDTQRLLDIEAWAAKAHALLQTNGMHVGCGNGKKGPNWRCTCGLTTLMSEIAAPEEPEK